MQQENRRSRQIAALIHKHMVDVLRTETDDPAFASVQLTTVKVSEDKGLARIYFVIADDASFENLEKRLNKAAGHFRTQLAQRLVLRYVPKLKFVYDASIERASKLTSLMETL